MNILGHIRRRWASLLLVVVVAAAFARLAWVASQCETGWDVVADDWRMPVLLQLGLEHRPWYLREYEEQARVLQAEVDRLLAEKPGDAATAMGCALLIDRPLKDERDPWAYVGEPDAFERMCSRRCLSLAADATRLEPDDVNWWRLRAQLLFGENVFATSYVPRSRDWRQTLEACAGSDPDNALYDRLAADQLVFEHGLASEAAYQACLNRAEKKPFLALGTRGRRCLRDAVAATSWSSDEKLAVCRQQHGLGPAWLAGLRFYQPDFLPFLDAKGAKDEASNVVRDLELAVQLEAAREIDFPQTTWKARYLISNNALQFNAQYPGVLAEDELALARRIQATASKDAAVFQAEKQRRGWPGPAPGPEMLLATLLGPRAVPLLLALAAVLLAIAALLLWRRSGAPLRVPLVGNVLLWLASAAMLIAVLGSEWPGQALALMAVAWLPVLPVSCWIGRRSWSLAVRWRCGELRPRRAHQLAVWGVFGILIVTWLLTDNRAKAALVMLVPVEFATVGVVVLVLAAFFLARWLAGKRGPSEATAATLVALGTIITGVLSAVALAACYQTYVATRWFRLFVPESPIRGGALSAVESFSGRFTGGNGVVYDWLRRDGPFWSIVLSLLLLGAWTAWRIGRARRRDPALGSRWAVGSWLRTLGLSCLVAAALCALPYLLLTPSHLSRADAYYQQVMAGP